MVSPDYRRVQLLSESGCKGAFQRNGNINHVLSGQSSHFSGSLDASVRVNMLSHKSKKESLSEELPKVIGSAES